MPSLPLQQTPRTDDFPSALLDGFVGNYIFKREDEKRAAANHSGDGANGMLAKPRLGLCVIVISANASPDNNSVAWLQPGCPSGPQPHWPVGDCIQSKSKEKTTRLKISFPIHLFAQPPLRTK